MYDAMKEALPYLKLHDLYLVMCYLVYDSQKQNDHSHDNAFFNKVIKSQKRIYTHDTFLRTFNVVQPFNFAKTNIDNMSILFNFADTYSNEQADIEILIRLMRSHFDDSQS